MWEILGIEPTNDIKAIKTAYARLAKQYNPEEHPEEFKRIHEAYRSACEYARNRVRYRIHIESSDNTGLDFSGLGNDEPKKDTEAKSYSFDNISTDRKPSEETQEKNETEFDFENVNTESHHLPVDPESHEPQYDFDKIRKNSEPAFQPVTEKTDSKYDFSPLDREKLEQTEEQRLERLKTDLLRRIRNMLSDSKNITDYKKWYDLFYDTYFDEIVNDMSFRRESAALFAGKPLTQEVANLAAYCFGNGSVIFCKNSLLRQWGVRITCGQPVRRTYNRNNSFFSGKSTTLPKWVGILVIAAAVFLFIVYPMIFFLDTDSRGTVSSPVSGSPTFENDGFITLRPYEEGEDSARYIADAFIAVVGETTFETEDLYQICMGEWETANGYIKFNSDYTFEMKKGNDIITGTLDARSAEKGAELYMTVHSDNEWIDNAQIKALLISQQGKKMVITTADGMIHPAKFKESLKETEVGN